MNPALQTELDASSVRLLRAWSLARQAKSEELRDWLGQLPFEELAAEPELGILLANAYMYTFDPRAVELERALAPIFEDRGNDQLARRFINLRGWQRIREGALSDAAAYFAEVEWRSNVARDERTLAYALLNQCIVAFVRLEIDQAMRFAERALALARRTGDVRSIAQLNHNIGILYRHLGMYPEAERYLDRALRYPMSQAEKVISEQEHALLYLLMGRIEAADRLARRSFDSVESMGLEALRADALRALALVSLARGDSERAEAELRRALPFCEGAAERQTHAQVLEELSAIALAAGRERESGELERAAAEIYLEMGAPRQAERLHERIAALRSS